METTEDALSRTFYHYICPLYMNGTLVQSTNYSGAILSLNLILSMLNTNLD